MDALLLNCPCFVFLVERWILIILKLIWGPTEHTAIQMMCPSLFAVLLKPGAQGWKLPERDSPPPLST